MLVVQWKVGKMKERVFPRTGALNKPPRPPVKAVQKITSTIR
jgi:hypothetical protein